MPFQYKGSQRAYRDTGLSDIGATVGGAVRSAAGTIADEMEAQEKARLEAELREAMRLEALRKEKIDADRFERQIGVQERGVKRLEDKDFMDMVDDTRQEAIQRQRDQALQEALSEMAGIDPQLQNKAEMKRNIAGVASQYDLGPDNTFKLLSQAQGDEMDPSEIWGFKNADREDRQAFQAEQNALNRNNRISIAREAQSRKAAGSKNPYIGMINEDNYNQFVQLYQEYSDVGRDAVEEARRKESSLITPEDKQLSADAAYIKKALDAYKANN